MMPLSKNSTAIFFGMKNLCHTITASKANLVNLAVSNHAKSQGKSSFKMGPSTRANGREIRRKDMACKSGRMAHGTKGFGIRIRHAEKESSYMQTETYTKAAGLMTRPTVKARIITRMGPYSAAFGAMTSNMGQGKRPTQMARDMLAITVTAKRLVKGNTSGSTVANTKGSGLRIRFMVMASIGGKMAEFTWATGKITKCMALAS